MQYKVINSQIEGEHPLQYVIPVRLSQRRLIVVVIACIFSGFTLALFFRWFPKLFLRIIFISEELDKATDFIAYPEYEICPKSKSRFTFRFLRYEIHDAQSCRPVEHVDNIEGLSDLQVDEQKTRFGGAQMVIPVVGFIEYTIGELSKPFYTLQYLCVVIWLIQGFFYFAVVMMSTSLLSTFIKFRLLSNSRQRLQQLAAIRQKVQVYRDNKLLEVDSDDIYPGDLIQLKQMMIPADCRLLGEALVNEATLTGESAPIPKSAGQTIFEGTKLINSSAKAVVLRTNYSTIRGQYFRNVLYPPKLVHAFYTQAFKFLAWFFIFNIIVSLATLYIYLSFSTELIIASVVGTLTWVFPPAMPIFFSMAASVALFRLNRNDVIGSNMDKIHIAGAIDTICFDKTGTLTTNELKVNQVIQSQDCSMILNCCHHLAEDNGQLFGDVLDLEMFNFAKGKISFNGSEITVRNGEKIYDIIKIFDFSSETMMLSVIVKYNEAYYLCSKGAPEKVIKKCINPIDQQPTTFTNQGLRVISLAQKLILESEINNNREQLEEGLNFCGYLIFENQLKSDTVFVMKQLIQARLNLKILSGDNPLTTISCGFETQILEDKVILLDLQQESITARHVCIENKIQCIQSEEVVPQEQLENYLNNVSDSMCLTGDMMNIIRDSDMDICAIYEKTKIFARVKPHQKKQVVEALQKQHQVAMVGDGSNDCSAISQANIGVSFSQSDASYTAHFSSLDQSIECIIKILLEGRCTTQTLAEIFPLYIVLAFLAGVAYKCLALEGQNYSDVQLIVISFGCYLPIMAFMTLSQPHDRLTFKKPLDDMYNIANMLSIYAHVIILSAGLVIVTLVVVLNPDHISTKPPTPITGYRRKGLLNSSTVIIALFYSVFIPLMLYQSKPFKQRFYFNYLFTLWVSIFTILAFIFLFVPSSYDFLGLVDFNAEMDNFNVYLMLITVGTIMVDYLVQLVISSKYKKWV